MLKLKIADCTYSNSFECIYTVYMSKWENVIGACNLG